MQLDVDDLRSLDLGRGRLLTEPLPVGEFLTLQARSARKSFARKTLMGCILCLESPLKF